MKEIELKAHVYDRKNIIKKLESFSTFVKSIKKALECLWMKRTKLC